MSHTIELRGHGLSKACYGHWTIPNLIWRLMEGRRFYFLNRGPYSSQKKYIEQLVFDIICEFRENEHSGIKRPQLSMQFENMPDDDLVTSGMFIQAKSHS